MQIFAALHLWHELQPLQHQDFGAPNADSYEDDTEQHHTGDDLRHGLKTAMSKSWTASLRLPKSTLPYGAPYMLDASKSQCAELYFLARDL